MLTNEDKHFLFSFEQGEPDWDSVEYDYFAEYLSIKWKLLNLAKLKKIIPENCIVKQKNFRRIFEKGIKYR